MKKILVCILLLIHPLEAFAQEKPETTDSKVLNCLKPSGHHASYRELTCPLGGEIFEVVTLGVHSRFGKTLDMRPISYLPLPPPIPVCPSNGFLMMNLDMSEEEIKAMQEATETEEYQKLFTERHASYYLLASILDKVADDDAKKWWVLLNASWEAEVCGDKEKYSMYVQAALIDLENEVASKEDAFWEYFQLANLSRRLGNFAKAEEWFLKIPKPEQIDENQELGLSLLQTAISEKNIEPVAFKKPKEQEKAKDND